MFNKLIHIARSTILNALLSVIWSPLLILLGLILFAQELGDENFWWTWTACSIINIFISAFVHLLFAMGGFFWIKQSFQDENQALESSAYILIIPSICYAAIAGLFIINNQGYIEYAYDFAAIAFITLLLIYSISLRTFLYQLLKIKQHEKTIG